MVWLVLLSAGGILGLIGILEGLQFQGIPRGGILCLVELSLTVFVAFHLIRSPRQKGALQLLFATAFSTLALADGVFFVVNYYSKENLLLSHGAGVASALYAFAFLVSSFALLQSSGFRLRTDSFRLLIPTILLLVAAGIYFVPLVLGAEAGGSFLALSLGQNLNFILSIVLGIIGLMVWVHTTSQTLVWVGLGLSILPLVNFLMSSEVFKKGRVDFGFAEYVWVFAIFLAEIGSILWSSEKEGHHPVRSQRLSGMESLGVRYRISVIAVVMIILIGASLFSTGLSIQFVTLGLILAFILGLSVSLWIVQSIESHSRLLGEHLESAWRNSRPNPVGWSRQLPVELEELMSTAFAERLEGLRRDRERSEKLNSLYKKLAHDIRSPLQALSHLLSDPNISIGDLRSSFTDAVGPMKRASDGILSQLSQEVEGHSLEKVQRLAIDLCGLIQQVVAIQQKAALSEGGAIRWIVKHPAHACYAWVEYSTLERMLLNALRNAGEAPDVSEVVIELTRRENKFMLRVFDDGRGASDEALAELNQGNAYSTKAWGHGIGLSGMREELLTQGVGIHFYRHGRGGFEVSLEIPMAPSRLILIEDDRAIQLAWRALAQSRHVPLEIFSPTPDVLSHLPPPPLEDTEICVDLRLGALSGLSVLETLKGRGYSHLTLVTSEPFSADLYGGWQVRDKSFPRN